MEVIRYDTDRLSIDWEWQSINSRIRAAPLRGTAAGRKPTQRGRSGRKTHMLADEQGAPLSLQLTGGDEHGKWSVDGLLEAIMVERPDPEEVARNGPIVPSGDIIEDL